MVRLLRVGASKQVGIRLARVMAGLVVVGTLLAVSWLAHKFGPDQACLHVVAWGASGMVWAAGAPAALTLASRGRAAQSRSGLAALAQVRGLSERFVEGAEVAACVESLAEVVLIPCVLLATIEWLLLGRTHLEGGGHVLCGVAEFGLLAAVILGLATGCCRC